MPRRRRRNSGADDIAEIFARGVILLAFAAYAPIVAWWSSIPPEGRTILITATTITALSGLGALRAIAQHRKQRRAASWKKAMADWSRNVRADSARHRQSARYFSDEELERFAAHLYAQMGYHMRHTGRTGDHGVDVRLITPEQQVELVQCKQWSKPVGEAQIREFSGAIAGAKAVRGWFWAPRGFTQPAKRWAKGKPIVLVDDLEIGRLVETAFEKRM